MQDEEGSSYGRDGMRKGEVVSVNALSDTRSNHSTGVLMVIVSPQARTLVEVTDWSTTLLMEAGAVGAGVKSWLIDENHLIHDFLQILN